jgi:hypothetical protein
VPWLQHHYQSNFAQTVNFTDEKALKEAIERLKADESRLSQKQETVFEFSADAFVNRVWKLIHPLLKKKDNNNNNKS